MDPMGSLVRIISVIVLTQILLSNLAQKITLLEIDYRKVIYVIKCQNSSTLIFFPQRISIEDALI